MKAVCHEGAGTSPKNRIDRLCASNDRHCERGETIHAAVLGKASMSPTPRKNRRRKCAAGFKLFEQSLAY
jgi:hypothetical protein